MARGMPSMIALLGLLAVAGYQNRDKIAEMLNSIKAKGAGGEPGQGGLDGVLGQLGGLAGNAGAVVNEGLGGLVDQFKQAGQGKVADSWVSTGPNQSVTNNQLEQAIGGDVLTELERRTGLSRDELLSRLARELPNAVDKLTPDGKLPT